MTLVVHTARVSSRDPDRFDITRKSGGPAGTPFAPSWDILRPALNARREAERKRELADRVTSDGIDPEKRALGAQIDLEADDIERRAWAAYVPAYQQEMRDSYRRHPEAWRALLARERVVLVCYCTDHQRCHRTLLAEILVKLGATHAGEIVADAERRTGS